MPQSCTDCPPLAVVPPPADLLQRHETSKPTPKPCRRRLQANPSEVRIYRATAKDGNKKSADTSCTCRATQSATLVQSRVSRRKKAPQTSRSTPEPPLFWD